MWLRPRGIYLALHRVVLRMMLRVIATAIVSVVVNT
jgi:hypothetical protein